MNLKAASEFDRHADGQGMGILGIFCFESLVSWVVGSFVHLAAAYSRLVKGKSRW